MNVGKIVGTPSYMAPEQAQGLATDARTDLFCLGCVMYRMATGEAPFKGSDTISTLMSVAMVEPAAPHVLNPGMPARARRSDREAAGQEPRRPARFGARRRRQNRGHRGIAASQTFAAAAGGSSRPAAVVAGVGITLALG